MGGGACVECLNELGCFLLRDHLLASVGSWSTDATVALVVESLAIHHCSLLFEPIELMIVLSADRILFSLLQFLELERLSGEVCETAQVNIGLSYLEYPVLLFSRQSLYYLMNVECHCCRGFKG